MKRYPKTVLQELGNEWRLLRQTGSGHVVLTHKDGARLTVSSSPSDARSLRNDLSLARRLVRESAQTKARA